jgi:hypothetical protein
MTPPDRKWIWIRVATAALLAWTLTATMALAASTPGGPAPDSAKSYVIPYFLVILAMALGLIIVCRSSNRSTDLRRSDDDD